MKHAATASKHHADPAGRAPRRAQESRSASQAPRLALDGPAPPILLTGPAREALVRRRAYEIYEGNGRLDGHALDDWLTAEAEIARLVLDGNGPVDDAGGAP